MIVDNELIVANAQSLAGASTTVVSASSYDMTNARELGEGEKVRAYHTIGVAVTGAGVNIRFNVIVADDAALTTGVVVQGTTRAFLATELTLNRDPIITEINPQIGSIGKRYLGVSYLISGGTVGVGTVTSRFVWGIQGDKKGYPIGYSVI